MIVRRGFALAPPELAELPTTPEERARNLAEHERHSRNVAWFNEHAPEIYRDHRGMHVCIAGGELFVAAEPGEAFAAAIRKHPDDRGATFSWYIPTHPGPAIHAHFRHLGPT